MDDLSVLIPYRGDGGPRDEIFDWLLARYAALLPKAEICVGRNEDDPFSRAKARNDAYRQATGDVFLVADADTVFNTVQIEAAVRLVSDDPTIWVLPYQWYYNLAEEYTRSILDQSPEQDVPEPTDESLWEFKLESWAGLLVMRRAAFERVKGYDERFIGWSFEDNAFRRALDTMVNPHRRLPSYALHLWHPVTHESTWGQPMFEHNRSLYKHYERCSGHRDAMRHLLESR